jgi:glycosyltransferase domain-containing protein
MKDVTIIIPTHNRHDYLSRLFSYYSGSKLRILCCDSSAHSYRYFIPCNIKYVHMPGFSFVDKMCAAIQNIDTKFIACCADDDFILKKSILEGVDFLNKEMEYSALVGRYVGFLKNFNGSFYGMYNKNSYVPSKIPIENAINFMGSYHMILWGLYRKEFLLESYSILSYSNFDNDNYIELVIGLVQSYRGKIKIVDKVWGVREIEFKGGWRKKHTTLCLVNDLIRSKSFKNIMHSCDNTLGKGVSLPSFRAYLSFCHQANKIGRIKLILLRIIPNCILSIAYSTLNTPINRNYDINEVAQVLKKNRDKF